MNEQNEQPDLFPEDAERAKKEREEGKDIITKLKERHKSTQFIRDLRRLKQRLKDKSNQKPRDPNSIIIKPKYKSKYK